MATIRRFEDIEAWKQARVLSQCIYRITRGSAFNFDIGLRNQLRRASVSAMANIAEGFERGGRKEFLHFLRIAKASVGEVESELYVALDEQYINQIQFDQLKSQATSAKRLIAGLMHYIKKHGRDQNDFSVQEPASQYGSGSEKEFQTRGKLKFPNRQPISNRQTQTSQPAN